MFAYDDTTNIFSREKALSGEFAAMLRTYHMYFLLDVYQALNLFKETGTYPAMTRDY